MGIGIEMGIEIDEAWDSIEAHEEDCSVTDEGEHSSRWREKRSDEGSRRGGYGSIFVME